MLEMKLLDLSMAYAAAREARDLYPDLFTPADNAQLASIAAEYGATLRSFLGQECPGDDRVEVKVPLGAGVPLVGVEVQCSTNVPVDPVGREVH